MVMSVRQGSANRPCYSLGFAPFRCFFLAFAHLAWIAFFASSFLSPGVSDAIRAVPPFLPPAFINPWRALNDGEPLSTCNSCSKCASWKEDDESRFEEEIDSDAVVGARRAGSTVSCVGCATDRTGVCLWDPNGPRFFLGSL